MGFINKIVDVVTGKTAIERKQQKFAMQQIRKDVMSAQLRERRQQAVKYAQEVERIKYKRKLEEINKPKINTSNYNFIPQSNSNYGSILGSPRLVRKIKVKNSKGKKRKAVIIPRYQFKEITKPQRYDVLGL